MAFHNHRARSWFSRRLQFDQDMGLPYEFIGGKMSKSYLGMYDPDEVGDLSESDSILRLVLLSTFPHYR